MSTMPLVFMSRGKKCRVDKIDGGDLICKKLMEMGFNTGAILDIVKNDVGPLIIGIGESRIALGRGMAQKIIIQE